MATTSAGVVPAHHPELPAGDRPPRSLPGSPTKREPLNVAKQDLPAPDREDLVRPRWRCPGRCPPFPAPPWAAASRPGAGAGRSGEVAGGLSSPLRAFHPPLYPAASAPLAGCHPRAVNACTCPGCCPPWGGVARAGRRRGRVQALTGEGRGLGSPLLPPPFPTSRPPCAFPAPLPPARPGISRWPARHLHLGRAPRAAGRAAGGRQSEDGGDGRRRLT